MKKLITMILAITLAITAVAVPSGKANAEETVRTAPVVTPPPDAGITAFVPSPAGTYTEPPAPVSTQTPVPTQIPGSDGYWKIAVKDFVFGKEKWRTGSDTWQLTKGFTQEMRLQSLGGDVNVEALWTSDRPDIASVDKSGMANGITVKGKKCGKATITAEYNGMKSYITVNVLKNEYKRELQMTPVVINNKGEIGCESGHGITSMKYDKKGNLKCTFTAMDRMNKSQYKKAKKRGETKKYDPKAKGHLGFLGRGILTIYDPNHKNKTLLKITIGNNDKDNYCCKDKNSQCHNKWGFDYKLRLNKPTHVKFTVKKKYLGKMKNVDLRTLQTVRF